MKRVAEHDERVARNLNRHDLRAEKSALAEHAAETGHAIEWTGEEAVTYERRRSLRGERRVKEALEIGQVPAAPAGEHEHTCRSSRRGLVLSNV